MNLTAIVIVLFGLAVVIAVDWLIVRAVWRKVNQPVEAGVHASSPVAGCAVVSVIVLCFVLGAIGLTVVRSNSRIRHAQELTTSTVFINDATVEPPMPLGYSGTAPPIPPAYIEPRPDLAAEAAANAQAAADAAARQKEIEIQLRQAQAELTRLQQQVDNGLAPLAELSSLKEEVDVLRAQQTGDPVKVAEARLQWAKQKLQDAERSYASGLTTAVDYEKASSAVELRQAEMETALSNKEKAAQAEERRMAAAASSATAANHTRDDLRTRLQATKLISSWMSRDAALASLAQDAANVDETGVVIEALTAISSWQTKDSAARSAARTIGRRGHREDAIQVAKLIASAQTRDTTLAELSK